MAKIYDNAAEAVADIPDGAAIAVGGCGLWGIPDTLVDALVEQGTKDLHVVSYNCGPEGIGVGKLLEHHRVRRLVAAETKENRAFAVQYAGEDLEVELIPPATLAARLRAAGIGVDDFYLQNEDGTPAPDGGVALHYRSSGAVAVNSAPRRTEQVDGDEYVVEQALSADFALVRAWKGDEDGNLVFRNGVRVVNTVCAMAGQVVIAEVERLLEPGRLGQHAVHLQAPYVDRMIALTPPRPSGPPVPD